MLPAEAGEGWYLMARLRGVPELDEVVVKLRGSLDLGDDLAQEAADEAVARVGTMSLKTLIRGENPHDLGLFAGSVRDAALNAVRPYSPRYRQHVASRIGRNPALGQAFETMEEFEFARTLPIESLDLVQRGAIREIRESIGHIAGVGTPISKVIPTHGPNGALNMLQSGNPNLAGFFCRTMDIEDISSTPALIRRLRLDHAESIMNDNSVHAVIETIADPTIAARSGIPIRPHAMGTPTPPGYVEIPASSAIPPNTGSGLTASLDGHLMPETWISEPTAMLPEVTTMRFREPSGLPKTYPTVCPDGVTREIHTWVLRADATSATGFSWRPHY